ncbi:ankyrin repeat domain-containing protein [Croceivirga thetidis]|uniref:Ankyrin repeat domain-containing protein n=1 Tax=Croceivirga thetidis TaxID=2721623 RepID=A0ABX1GL12_9FLAO|nr:ankyrin repeat domain-containing protein [Croceivirga thetidis]NKI30329.1 ankyrin repeat domain-containing protein [Croceivirga thetidis]
MKRTILTVAFALSMLVDLSASEKPEPYFDNTIVVEFFKPNSFCRAIMNGDTETVKKMIQLGEDINQKSLGMTPLHFAARYNKAEIMEVLLENGADLDKRCDKGYTVRKHAELSNADEALKVLKAANKK